MKFILYYVNNFLISLFFRAKYHRIIFSHFLVKKNKANILNDQFGGKQSGKLKICLVII